MSVRRSFPLAVLALLGAGLAAETATAQVIVGTPAPSYGTAPPAVRYAAPAGVYAYPSGGWYAARPTYVVPGGYPYYTYPGYYPSRGWSGYQTYRSYINSGADPNYPARRGLRLYKPWLY